MKYFHGSYDELPIGTVLVPQKDYETKWGQEEVYQWLEGQRPAQFLARSRAVFMCDNDSDIDNAGGGTQWLFEIEPIGVVERHDMAWLSLIQEAMENGDEVSKLLYAHNYWHGITSEDPVWEYLTPGAKIVHVEPY